MTSYFIQFHCYKSCWRQQIFKFSIEIGRTYQEYSKNVVFDNFHQLNWKWWLVVRGFGAHNDLALAVACWFWSFVVMWWVCVCLGLGQCFWDSLECTGDGFLGVINYFITNWRKLERVPCPYIRIRDVSFLKITSSLRSYAWTFTFALPLIIQTRKGDSHILELGMFLL